MVDVAVEKTDHCKVNSKDEHAQFLMVDFDDQLAHEFEEARNELYKQAATLATKINLLWEVVRTMIVFFIPVVTGIGLAFFSKSYLPDHLAVYASAVFNGLTIGLVLLNLVPLNVAVTNYLDSRVYTPRFVNCTCKKCQDKYNCSNEQQEGKQTAGDMQDKKNDSTNNSIGIKAAENADGLKIGNGKSEDISPKREVYGELKCT